MPKMATKKGDEKTQKMAKPKVLERGGQSGERNGSFEAGTDFKNPF